MVLREFLCALAGESIELAITVRATFDLSCRENWKKYLEFLFFLHVIREIVSLDSILYPRIVTIAYDSQENYDVEVVVGGVLTNLYMDSTTTYFHRTVAQLHYDDL